MVRRLAPIGLIWHFVVIFGLTSAILVTTEPGSSQLSPFAFARIGDFILFLLLAYGLFFLVWSLLAAYKTERIATRVMRRGGTACVHCGYLMDPGVTEGVCPECGKAYRREKAVRQWSAVCPRAVRRNLELGRYDAVKKTKIQRRSENDSNAARS